MAPSSSVDTSTVTSETSSSVPTGDTEPPDTLQPDGITSTDPGAQATELENMLDADPDDVCTARRVFVLADRKGWDMPVAASLTIKVAITLVVSVASYFLIEKPIRTATWMPPRRTLVAALVAIALGFPYIAPWFY